METFWLSLLRQDSPLSCIMGSAGSQFLKLGAYRAKSQDISASAASILTSWKWKFKEKTQRWTELVVVQCIFSLLVLILPNIDYLTPTKAERWLIRYSETYLNVNYLPIFGLHCGKCRISTVLRLDKSYVRDHCTLSYFLHGYILKKLIFWHKMLM